MIKVPLIATTKQDAIGELVDSIASVKAINRDLLVQDILIREKKQTTAVARDIAFPHAKSDACSDFSVSIGVSSVPIDFGAVNNPVHIIILFACPTKDAVMHIYTLARLSRLVSSNAREKILLCNTPEMLFRLICDMENSDV